MNTAALLIVCIPGTEAEHVNWQHHRPWLTQYLPKHHNTDAETIPRQKSKTSGKVME